MKIKVYFMSAAGNLFTVIDNRDYQFSITIASKLAPFLCNINEHNSFKSEGFMLLNSGNDKIDFNCDFFNPDGSTGMMCGNGGRAIVFFAKSMKAIKDKKQTVIFSMAKNIYTAEFKNDTIKLYLPAQSEIKNHQHVTIDEIKIEGAYVNVGTDHFVINFDKMDISKSFDFNDFPINNIGAKIRFHSEFEPRGVNANFYKIIDENKLRLRTYERGVEAETGACGTGAISTALVAALNNEITLPVTIIPTSGKKLIVDIVGLLPNYVDKIILEGDAEIIESKEINLDFASMNI